MWDNFQIYVKKLLDKKTDAHTSMKGVGEAVRVRA